MSYFKALLGPKLLSNITAEDDFDIREYPDDEEQISSSCSTPPHAQDRGEGIAEPTRENDDDDDVLFIPSPAQKHGTHGAGGLDVDTHGSRERENDLASFGDASEEGEKGDDENENDDLNDEDPDHSLDNDEDRVSNNHEEDISSTMKRMKACEIEIPPMDEDHQHSELDPIGRADFYSNAHSPTSCSGFGDFGLSEDCFRGDHGNTTLVDTDKALHNRCVGVYVSDFKKPDDNFLAMLRQKYTFLRSKGVEVVFAWKHPRHDLDEDKEKERNNDERHGAKEFAQQNLSSSLSLQTSSNNDAAAVGEEHKGFFIDDEAVDDLTTNRRTWDAVTARMPWYLIPFANSSRQAEHLCKEFKVTILPVFMIFDDEGELITLDGRGKLMTDVEHAPWLAAADFHSGITGLASRAIIGPIGSFGPIASLSSVGNTDVRMSSKFPSPRSYGFSAGITRTRSQGELSDGESTTCSSMSRPRSPSATSNVNNIRFHKGPCDKALMEGVPILSHSALVPRLERYEKKAVTRSRSWSYHGGGFHPSSTGPLGPATSLNQSEASPTLRSRFDTRCRSLADRPLLHTADVGGSFVGSLAASPPGGLGLSSGGGGDHSGGLVAPTPVPHISPEQLIEAFPGNLSLMSRDPRGLRRPSLPRPAPMSAPSVVYALPTGESGRTSLASSLLEESSCVGDQLGAPFEGSLSKKWFTLNTSLHHPPMGGHAPGTRGTPKVASSGDLG